MSKKNKEKKKHSFFFTQKEWGLQKLRKRKIKIVFEKKKKN
jgi:hypothetical protein